MLISWLLICPCLVAVIKASASLGRTVSNAEDVASSQLSLQNDFPIIPATAAPLPDTYWPLDAPSPITNFTALRISPNLTAPNIACDGKAYGRNLRFDSCLQVWHAMSNVDKPRWVFSKLPPILDIIPDAIRYMPLIAFSASANADS